MAAAIKDVALFLCGDVMTGRGIDQALPHPGDPRIKESPWGGSALDYVRLAEAKNGAIARPVSWDYIWGDALQELSRREPHARIVNLETAITSSENWEPKGINYRMHPANAGCLSAARIDCCVLANNHALDFGASGLIETLETLSKAGIKTAGAGRDGEQARAPAILNVPQGRVLVFGLGSPSSGAPEHWMAGESRPGIWILNDFGEAALQALTRQILRWRQPGDLVVVSLHWGGNWGYEVPQAHAAFAHGLIDRAGVDVIHGHSSHHPKGIEIYRGKPILYGCGDLIDDYEGISGYEEYRPDLRLMYFVSLDAASRALLKLALVPVAIERFRLRRVEEPEVVWLQRSLERASRPFGTRFRVKDGALLVEGREAPIKRE